MGQVTAEMIEQGRSNPAATSAAQRRRTAQQMRHARERLTSSGAGQRTFDIELLQAFVTMQRVAVPVQVLLAVVTAMVMSFWAPIEAAVAWLVPVLGAAGFSLHLTARFTRNAEAGARHERWKRRFVLAGFIQSVAWAGLAALFRNHMDPFAGTCVLLALLINSAMSSLMLSSVLEIVYASLIPTAIGIVSPLLPSITLIGLSQTTLACAAQIFCFIVARRLYAISLAHLVVQAERDASIVELEQARANSDEARRRAEEANLAKSRFLATMSHELRTPLNAILGFSEVMKSELFGAHSAPIYKEYSSDVHASGEHLLMLINEILDLSRVEAGRYDLREEPVQLAFVVDDCLRLLTLRASKRAIVLNESIERALPRIWADERAMRQAVLNLLSNAIKFTPQGGTVTIALGRTAEQGQFVSITDTGPGIPESEMPVVMSSFGRGTLAQKNAEEGSGLGLPIVKGLIDMHGGTFTLTSKVREGTVATIVMPPERVIDALPQIGAGTDHHQPRPRRSLLSAA